MTLKLVDLQCQRLKYHQSCSTMRFRLQQVYVVPGMLPFCIASASNLKIYMHRMWATSPYSLRKLKFKPCWFGLFVWFWGWGCLLFVCFSPEALEIQFTIWNIFDQTSTVWAKETSFLQLTHIINLLSTKRLEEEMSTC